jgi:Zn-dependent protease with chaperone function
MKVYAIRPEELPQGSSTEAIRDAESSSEGAQLLRDQVLTDVTIATTVNQLGLPAAIGFASSRLGQIQRLVMFYKTPPRSLVLQRSPMSIPWLLLSGLYESRVVADLPAVPHSVQRLLFQQKLPTPSWPVTISPEWRDAFSVPPLPPAPSPQVDGHYFDEMAATLTAIFPLSENVQNQKRAEQALIRLKQAAQVEGLQWRVTVVRYVGAIGFGVPDGTLFVSDDLVQQLDDRELAAVLAHLMGHAWHQHGRATLRLFGYTDLLHLPLPKSYSAALSYLESHEREANAVAIRILDGASIGPDALFDAMVKLADNTGPQTWYRHAHHLSAETILSYGLWLDAGLGVNQP